MLFVVVLLSASHEDSASQLHFGVKLLEEHRLSPLSLRTILGCASDCMYASLRLFTLFPIESFWEQVWSTS